MNENYQFIKFKIKTVWNTARTPNSFFLGITHFFFFS